MAIPGLIKANPNPPKYTLGKGGAGVQLKAQQANQQAWADYYASLDRLREQQLADAEKQRAGAGKSYNRGSTILTSGLGDGAAVDIMRKSLLGQA